MRRVIGLFILTILSGSIVFAAGNDSKKVQRLIAKGDKAFDNFVYVKAVDYYEKALDEKAKFDAEVSLKIADSYRLMNKPRSAEPWYAKVEDTEVMTEQDLMNYAQILLRNGKDQKAKEISSQIKVLDLSKFERLKKIDNVEIYYADSAAYYVENMNINTPESEFSPTYLDDGFVFVSNRDRDGVIKQATYGWDDTYFLDLYYAKVEDGKILEPEPMTKRINTIFHEGPAVFFDDGNKLIFTRNNFNLGEERTSVEGVNMLKLYYTEKDKKGKWGKPTTLPFNSDDYSVGHPTFDDASQTLYFASDMPGGQGNSDIYKVKYLDGKWGTPENLGDKINTIEDELFPFIGEDGDLYFASEGHPGIGGLDVYAVNLEDESSEVKNMGYPINTPDDDFAMIIDGKVGYLSSNRLGGRGYDDIYKVYLYKYDITARLVDFDSGEELDGSIVATDLKDESALAETEDEGKVYFNIIRGKEIKFSGAKDGYKSNELSFSTLDIPLEADSFVVDIPLRKPNLFADVIRVTSPTSLDLFSNDEALRFFDGSMEELKKDLDAKYYKIADIYDVESIYYDFDKANIREDAQQSLDALVEVLNKFEDFTVQLGAHTDSRGSNTYNDYLAKRRVKAAYDYLIENGVKAERISTGSFGEEELLNDCGDGVPCNKQQHQLNRRTEVRLEVKK